MVLFQVHIDVFDHRFQSKLEWLTVCYQFKDEVQLLLLDELANLLWCFLDPLSHRILRKSLQILFHLVFEIHGSESARSLEL